MSRPSRPGKGDFLLRQNIFMSRQSWPGWEDFLSRLSILCCDRVGQGRENLYRDKGILGRDRVGHYRKLCHTTRLEREATMHWARARQGLGGYMTRTCA